MMTIVEEKFCLDNRIVFDHAAHGQYCPVGGVSMSPTKKRIAVFVSIMAASLVMSTSALADPGDPECWTTCAWWNVGCIISHIMAGC